MKRILFSLALTLAFGATRSAWACDCAHKKQQKACKANCDPKSCPGDCNQSQTQDTKTDTKKDAKK